MPVKVAKIEQTFSINGMGTVIVLPKTDEWAIAANTVFYKDERIQIRTPDGSCLATYIKGIELIRRKAEHDGICFSLPHPIVVEDIPAGSEIWLE